MLPGDLLDEPDAEHAFGALLTTLRSRVKGKKIKQKDIVVCLPGWTISSYSRLENGELAPRFDQLLSLYRAFQQIGIPFSPDARQQFVELARKRIALQKTHKDIRSDAEWAQLQATFPGGVCDWSKPGVNQQPSTPWLTFAGGPGGQQLGPAPTSQSVKG